MLYTILFLPYVPILELKKCSKFNKSSRISDRSTFDSIVEKLGNFAFDEPYLS